MNLDRILPLVRQEIAALGREFRHAPAAFSPRRSEGPSVLSFQRDPSPPLTRATQLITMSSARPSTPISPGSMTPVASISDLISTVLSPSRLSIYRSLQPGHLLPRKGAHAYGDAILIELKFFHERVGVQGQLSHGSMTTTTRFALSSPATDDSSPTVASPAL